MAAPPLIIGLTGPFGSGTTTVGEWLAEKYGFVHFRVHDIISRHLSRRHTNLNTRPVSIQRKLMQDAGDELRRTHGCGYLVNKALEQAKQLRRHTKGVVLDSLKNPYEVEEIRRHPNALMLAICADKDARWERVRKKSYNGNQSRFNFDDARDSGRSDGYGQNVTSCVDLADISLDNSKPCESDDDWDVCLWQPVQRSVKLATEPGSEPPTVEEVFMNEAYCKSLSSKCLKRHVGAVVTVGLRAGDDQQQVQTAVSSAFNAVPRGQKECVVEYKGRCYRDKLMKERVEDLKYCPMCGEKLKSDHVSCSSCHLKVTKALPGKNLEAHRRFVWGESTWPGVVTCCQSGSCSACRGLRNLSRFLSAQMQTTGRCLLSPGLPCFAFDSGSLWGPLRPGSRALSATQENGLRNLRCGEPLLL